MPLGSLITGDLITYFGVSNFGTDGWIAPNLPMGVGTAQNSSHWNAPLTDHWRFRFFFSVEMNFTGGIIGGGVIGTSGGVIITGSG